MKKRIMRANVAVDTIFTLTLFVVFAIAVLFVMLTGVKVYRNAAAESAESGDARIADAYLVSKIRQFDASVPGNSVRIEKSGTGEMLVLTENYDGIVLATCIYCADGYLRELFYDTAEPFDPSLGERIIAADRLHLETDGRLLRFSVDGEAPMAVCLYTETEAGGR